MSGLSVNTGAMDANGKQTVANAESFANELASDYLERFICK